MHGELECAGNVQQLCAIRHSSFPVWWEFIQCQLNKGRSNIGKLEVAEECADSTGLGWSRISSCATSDEGERLLKENIRVTKEMGIQKSCTMMINAKVVCIKDGTWQNCTVCMFSLFLLSD